MRGRVIDGGKLRFIDVDQHDTPHMENAARVAAEKEMEVAPDWSAWEDLVAAEEALLSDTSQNDSSEGEDFGVAAAEEEMEVTLLLSMTCVLCDCGVGPACLPTCQTLPPSLPATLRPGPHPQPNPKPSNSSSP